MSFNVNYLRSCRIWFILQCVTIYPTSIRCLSNYFCAMHLWVISFFQRLVGSLLISTNQYFCFCLYFPSILQWYVLQLLIICPSFPIHHPFLANLAITTSTEKWKKERNRKKKKKKQGYMHCMAILSHTEQDLLDWLFTLFDSGQPRNMAMASMETMQEQSDMIAMARNTSLPQKGVEKMKLVLD